MQKKRIGAKEAAADIREGMDDSRLMEKYHLSVEGLQSLFDKLVHKGFIDLSDVEKRMPGFLGTVVVSESLISRVKQENQVAPVKSKPKQLVNAQEAGRDIRLGADDSVLMDKYRLSPKQLGSLFDKLKSRGLITQADLDRRRLDDEHTVDLKEEKLSFADALQQLGLDEQRPAPVEIQTLSQLPVSPPHEIRPPTTTVHEPAGHEEVPAPSEREDEHGKEAFGRHWFDNPFALIGALLVFFPAGIYALCRNNLLSVPAKIAIVLVWAALAGTCVLLASDVIDML
ncbi:MAG TPA: hypothetical protein VK463_07745 [Desulfomonilaceae bacterium]|nr:hypothetical protein [Desulfomonilaceae bacterium]